MDSRSANKQAQEQAVYDNQVQQQEIADLQAQNDALAQQQAQMQQAPPAAPSNDMMAQLNQLAQLHTAGVLSDEEFALAKQKLLAV